GFGPHAAASPAALTMLKPAASRPKERRDIPLMGQVYLNSGDPDGKTPRSSAAICSSAAEKLTKSAEAALF
ncbi:MAG: hypothetical protein WBW75_29320, partial [Mycobacterium sp.]|uniref:hypothetical protein n=1 Tax=Mycobacterium sp. TaxID=1785 RepID=UPI003C48CEFB